MSDKKITDQYGTEIAIGDLVVTNGKVGMVSGINAHNAPNVRIPSTRNVYAWEYGAPQVEKTGKRAKRDEQGYYVREPNTAGGLRGGWVYEEYTWMDKDRRVVDTIPHFYTVIRQNTSDLTVLRKIDGTIPSPFLDAIKKHEIMFPAKVVDDAPDVG